MLMDKGNNNLGGKAEETDDTSYAVATGSATDFQGFTGASSSIGSLSVEVPKQAKKLASVFGLPKRFCQNSAQPY